MARSRSFRRYLTLLVLVPLLPVVVFTAVLIVVIHREHAASVERGLHATARAVASAVDRKLASTITTLEAMASSRHLRAADLRQFAADARRVLPTQPGWSSVELVTPEGEVLLSVAAPSGQQLGGRSDIHSLQRVRRTQAPVVGGVAPEGGGDGGAFAVRVPVRRGGAVTYVLSAIVSPVVITRVLAEQDLPPGWLGYVVDEDMRFVARSLGDAAAGSRAAVGEPVGAPLAEALARRQLTAFWTTTREGEDVYTAIAKSDVADWSVALAAPAILMYGGLWSSLVVLGVGSALAVSAAIALAAILARRVRRPVTALTRAATAVGRGDTVAFEPTGIYELDAVAGALELASTKRRDAEAALRSARDKLEAATRVKDQVFASVSHELRTPLQAIVGWARALEREPPLPREEQLRAIRTIAENAAIQTRLVDDLLDVARMQSGRLPMKPASVDITDVLAAAMAAVSPAADAKGVEIRIAKVPAVLRPLSGDADRLRQVVWNLLANAVKFTPPPGRVEIDVREGDEELVMTIADTGEGISADLLPHVFEPFQQGADGGRLGLGLGLAIVRQIVEAHGGAVSAHSGGPGKGAVFSVRLPWGRAPGEPGPR
ncbi:MAG TPA: sensor histidine kinase [Candidatus Limnocylindria bacterium]|nr:sensor histidine kinase [Candidatus Limnocylindria bacterium]